MSKKKLKIAFVHPDLGIGGAERLVLDVAGALHKQGHQVYFLTNHFDKTHAFDELKGDEYQVQVYGDWLPRSIFGRFQAFCAYIRMMYLTILYVLWYRKQDNPDLYSVDLIPIAIPILKWANLKVIYYCHHPDLLASAPGGTLKKLYRKPIDWLEAKATARADVILVNSKYTASVFRKTFPEITKTIQVLYPTIAYSYQQTIADSKGDGGTISNIIPQIDEQCATLFLSLNRFHPAKKLELVIEAMSELQKLASPKEWGQIHLVVAGGYDPQSTINANYYAQLEELVAKLDLDRKVHFAKSPPDDIKAELLSMCTCLVYTPVNEHFGIVPLEAMAVSKPVIACNSGGPRETVNHGITGYLCEPNAASMSQFMHQMLDSTRAKQMGVEGKRTLEGKFSYDSFSRNLESVLKQCFINKED